MIKRITALALSVALAAAPAFAQEEEGGGRSGSPFRLDPALDGTLLGAAVGLNGAVFYMDEIAGLNRMDFSGGAYDASLVNGLDRFLMNPYSGSLSDVGTYLSVASLLTPAVLVLAPSDEWLTIGTMYAETVLMAYGLKELGKLCVNRPRPYMYFEDYPQDAVDDGDWSDSFPSGHTALAFAGATFASYVFAERFPDSGLRLPVTASSYALAFGTAALRISSGGHFLSDVLAGAAIGSACGFFVPYLHSLGADGAGTMTVRVAPTGALVSFAM
ncbi:MAG: hypothetical protein CVV47_03420 [Spirochaetae bacterium HGW-Spirochaetae-3]|jgi:undecaprenyl-diphosphatase|nr:MAG: hypothetical protein CVV47_03420 [Spirochaetae bacterium HGW-Spirochaetae-3]